nr:hypothetical protein Itr_chr06CG16010 [Ipomoea trifida]
MVIEEEIKTPAMVALRLSPSSSDRTACANLHRLSKGCRISLSHSSVKHQDRLCRSDAQQYYGSDDPLISLSKMLFLVFALSSCDSPIFQGGTRVSGWF